MGEPFELEDEVDMLEDDMEMDMVQFQNQQGQGLPFAGLQRASRASEPEQRSQSASGERRALPNAAGTRPASAAKFEVVEMEEEILTLDQIDQMDVSQQQKILMKVEREEKIAQKQVVLQEVALIGQQHRAELGNLEFAMQSEENRQKKSIQERLKKK